LSLLARQDRGEITLTTFFNRTLLIGDPKLAVIASVAGIDDEELARIAHMAQGAVFYPKMPGLK
jgi:hypothetical protein